MSKARRVLTYVVLPVLLVAVLVPLGFSRLSGRIRVRNSTTLINKQIAFDKSASLLDLTGSGAVDIDIPDCDKTTTGCGTSPGEAEGEAETEEMRERMEGALAVSHRAAKGSAAVEQTAMGSRPAMAMIASFDGLGVGLSGPHGIITSCGRGAAPPGALPGTPPPQGRGGCMGAMRGLGNPSDNALAVGKDHIVQIVNGGMAVFTKKGAVYDTTGRVLYGPTGTNRVFSGFGGECERRSSGDAVVRYDQLADRWLFVLPLFSRLPTAPGQPQGPYGMCYAVSVSADPLGPYYRYAFERQLFPDYPRPAVWIDGYYNPSSTGDGVIEKHDCVADRTRMLLGLPATEQCFIVTGSNFLNNADIDGKTLPPPGSPNIVIAAGGSQLKGHFEDDGLYAYKFHVDWNDPSKTTFTGPTKLTVAPYHYLCNGQLTRCVPQPGDSTRLDSQGDKIMQRLVYRNFGGHEAILANHSINTEAGKGGVRWYELRLNESREPYLYQQSTYTPDSVWRWMPSMAFDRQGNIGVGYSYGDHRTFPGQRFAGRLAEDPLGQLTFHETVMVNGENAQRGQLRWEDYTTTAMDPSDDCTFWYVGDYVKKDAASYSSKIGGFRMPGCLRGELSGSAYLDLNRNGKREADEPGLAGRRITVGGAEEATVTTDPSGAFSVSMPADAAYSNRTYTVSDEDLPTVGTALGTAQLNQGLGAESITLAGRSYSVRIADGNRVSGLNFAFTCTGEKKSNRKGELIPAGCTGAR